MAADRARGIRIPSTRPGASWRTSAAVLLVLAAATGGLHVLFDEQSWWLLLVLVIAAVLSAAAGARALTRRAWLPPLAGSVVMVLISILFFAADTAIVGLVPTLDTLERWGTLALQANDSIYRQSIPATADTPIVFVLSLSVGVIAVLCDLLAITLRAPAVTGVFVLGILAVPAFTLPDITDPFVFVLTAAAFLLLLVVGSSRRQSGLATAIGSAAIVGTLVLPLVLPDVNAAASRGVPGSTIGVNPIVSLGDDLRRASERTVLTYTTSGSGRYLRLVALQEFDGDQWKPTEGELDRDNTIDEFGPVPGLDPQVATAAETTSFSVRNLTGQWLPIPYPARSIEGLADDTWYWDSAGFSVASDDATPRGEEYVVDSLVLQPTPDQLLAAGTTVAAGTEGYLELPDGLPTVISDTARNLTASSPTFYEKALALQEYFRSDSFTYSEEAPVEENYDGTGMDVIAEFLQKRAGYCVHFASAMALMSRSLGIPTRVVVGFLPGTPSEGESGTTTYSVTNHDLHSWPEMYFQGIGWVQFEPTPGRGAPSAYADTTVAGVPTPVPPPTVATPQPQPSDAPAPSASQAPDAGRDAGGGAPTVTESAGPLPWIALAALGVFLLSLVPAGIRALQRRRLTVALRSRDATAVDAWTEVVRTAVDLDHPVARTETPRETATALGIGTPALGRILSATEETVYASTTLIDPRSLVDDVRAVRRAMADAAPGRARRWASFYPASVWRRMLHPLSPRD